MIAPFNNLLVKNRVGVVSVRDFQKRHKNIFGDIELTQCKQVLMYELMKQYFGTKHGGDGMENEDRKEEPEVTEIWKVLCIGDSSVEFEASQEALSYYLKEQSPDALSSINVSLHRVKFESLPGSFQKLESELRWCTDRIDAIVHRENDSADYVYSEEEK